MRSRELLAEREIARIGNELDRIMGEVIKIKEKTRRIVADERRQRLLEADFAAHCRVKLRYQSGRVPTGEVVYLRPAVEKMIAQTVAQWVRGDSFNQDRVLHRCDGSLRYEAECVILLKRYTGAPASAVWRPRKEGLWLLAGCLSGHTPHRKEFRELLETLFVRLWSLPRDK